MERPRPRWDLRRLLVVERPRERERRPCRGERERRPCRGERERRRWCGRPRDLERRERPRDPERRPCELTCVKRGLT